MMITRNLNFLNWFIWLYDVWGSYIKWYYDLGSQSKEG